MSAGYVPVHGTRTWQNKKGEEIYMWEQKGFEQKTDSNEAEPEMEKGGSAVARYEERIGFHQLKCNGRVGGGSVNRGVNCRHLQIKKFASGQEEEKNLPKSIKIGATNAGIPVYGGGRRKGGDAPKKKSCFGSKEVPKASKEIKKREGGERKSYISN